MNQRHNGWRIGGLVSTIMLALTTCAYADMTFNTFASQLIFKTSASQLLLGKAQNISGWSDLSIAKDFGRNTPASWVEGFASGAIVSQSGGTAVPQIHLIQANSNAINKFKSLYGDPSLVTQNSIDGTTYVQYEQNHHVFHNNGVAWTVRGWVRFNNGFTVMPLASVIMDTLTTVSGGMDLRDTGTLILNNDLYLSHNVTLTNGGNIKGQSSSSGQANTIFMGGDLTLASTTYARTLHITGDWSNSGTSGNLIIDGCGHTLNIGDRAQIFVDQNVTLTLRNMTIKTGPKSFMNPAIQLASFGSKLALDNVMFDLGTDLRFLQGQLFIHDEVAVTGTSAFIYQSPRPSYITSGATWSFEPGTTFNIAPATYTDRLFTAGTATSNNFIVLADQSSALSLNNCSLKTTFTGARLTKGMVLFDNKVAIDTQASVDINGAGEFGGGIAISGTPNSVAWTPDGRYLAVACGDDLVHVYRFDSASGAIEIGSGLSTGVGSSPNSVAWSPDGRYLAVTCISTSVLRIYRFNGASLPVEIGNGVAAAPTPLSASWSSDGRFLAVACASTNMLRIYRFNGASVPVEIGSGLNISEQPNFVSWSPDGRYLAVATYSGYMRIYKFNGQRLLGEVGSGVSFGVSIFNVAWSPDGRFLAVAPNTTSIYIYSFNGISVPVPVVSFPLPVGDVWNYVASGITWSPDGRYVAVAEYPDPDWKAVSQFEVYAFDGVGTLSGPIMTWFLDYSFSFPVVWSIDNKLALVESGIDSLHVYGFGFAPTDVTQQAFTNGLLFGDKAKGSNFDADVRFFGGAAVTVNGMVKDDSA